MARDAVRLPSPSFPGDKVHAPRSASSDGRFHTDGLSAHRYDPHTAQGNRTQAARSEVVVTAHRHAVGDFASAEHRDQAMTARMKQLTVATVGVLIAVCVFVIGIAVDARTPEPVVVVTPSPTGTPAF